jgi:hypothetical protein
MYMGAFIMMYLHSDELQKCSQEARRRPRMQLGGNVLVWASASARRRVHMDL